MRPSSAVGGFLLVFLIIVGYTEAALTPSVGNRAINPGENQMRLGTDAASASRDIGVTFYTPELSIFNDQTCANGPCRNDIVGLAHRSWPLGSCVAVCNLQNDTCAIAIVMDRGPNEALRRRTIDANPALRSALQMRGGLVPATYELISLNDEPCNAGRAPSGTIQVAGIDQYSMGANTYVPGVGSNSTGAPTNAGYPNGGLQQALGSQQQYAPQGYGAQSYPAQPATIQPGQSFIAPPPIQGQISTSLTQHISEGTSVQGTLVQPSVADSLLALLKPPAQSSVSATTSPPRINPEDAVVFIVRSDKSIETVPIPASQISSMQQPPSQTFVSGDMANQPRARENVAQGTLGVLDFLKSSLLRILDLLRIF